MVNSAAHRLPLVVLIVAAVVTIQLAREVNAQSAGEFAGGGRLLGPTSRHFAATLPDDTVLVAGGWDGSGVYLEGEVYIPDTQTSVLTGVWSSNVGHYQATGATLNDGRVLIVGGDQIGSTGLFETIAAGDVYSPVTRSWTATQPMSSPRVGHAATTLSDGRVLIVGGAIVRADGNFDFLATAELYNPATNSFTATGSLLEPRAGHSAVRLQSGRVLIVGCSFTSVGELYDPLTGSFSVSGSPVENRCNATATLLRNGLVLIAGGQSVTGFNHLRTAELYDPATGTFRATGSMATARAEHTATLLPDGRVLIVGGSVGGEGVADVALASAEIYNPATGAFSPAGNMATARAGHTASLLSDGQVVIVGGENSGFDHPVAGNVVFDTVEMFTPPAPTAMLTGSFSSSGGVTLAVWSGGTADQLVDAATDEGCTLQSFWVNREGGGLVGFIPTPIESVNREFFNEFPGGALASMPVIVVCRRG
jgi:hypothetical protein